eukprot:440422-Pyramimonas_sp.AAC.1
MSSTSGCITGTTLRMRDYRASPLRGVLPANSTRAYVMSMPTGKRNRAPKPRMCRTSSTSIWHVWPQEGQ